MRRPHGFGQIIGDPAHGFGMSDHDSVRCIHCGHIDMVRSSLTGKLEVMVFKKDGSHQLVECGHCQNCMSPICPRCVGKPCDNLFRRIENQERAAMKKVGLIVPAVIR